MPMLSHEGKSERAIDGNTAAAHVAYALSHPAASHRVFAGLGELLAAGVSMMFFLRGK